MNNQPITVFYKWTANDGKLEELKSMYDEVYQAMKDNEPDSLKMESYVSEDENAIFVLDIFKDNAALGFHLNGTAAQHFPELLKIATPGPFYFCGDVAEELKQAAIGMQMGAVFGTYQNGFER